MSRHHKHNGIAKGAAWERIRRQVFARDKRRCTQCGKAGRLEVHHVKPLDRGGTNDLSNLETWCRSCHIDHHRRPLTEWEQFAIAGGNV